MPTYEYRREDGTIFEANQSIKEDALKTCPTTGQKVTRLISGGTGLIFKGTGFYLTDYARKNTSTAERSGEAKGEDSKPDAAPKENASKKDVAPSPSEKSTPEKGSSKSE